MKGFEGTPRLVQLALRRDRLQLPIWISGIMAIFVVSIASVLDLYGNSLEEKIGYARLVSSSIVNRLLGGTMTSLDIGSIVMIETFLFASISIALMNILAVIRHTRHEEEGGRTELIGSAPVGRFAGLTAALSVVFLANMVIAGLALIALLAYDLPLKGSVLMSASFFGVGVCFAGIAAITAQLSQSARVASGLAGLMLGLDVLIRGIGDSSGQLSADGLFVSSTRVSWASIIGWGQQSRPFTDNKLWVIVLYIILFIVLIGVAFLLRARRDMGAGYLPLKDGPAEAAPTLLSTFGLSLRLQKGIIFWWLLPVFLMAVCYGAVLDEAQKMLTENEQLAELISQMGNGSTDLTNAFIIVMMGFFGLLSAAFIIQMMMRMRSEEAIGRLEGIVASPVNRLTWMLSFMSVAVVGTILLLAFSGIGMALGYILVADISSTVVRTIMEATLVQLPPVLVFGGIATLLYGIVPRISGGLTWFAFALSLIISQFGKLFKLPDWVLTISPFHHVAAVPLKQGDIDIIVLVLLVGIILMAIGLAGFRKRDIG